jgi:hypothetical protein
VDENRAFLNADRQDQIPLYARLKGEKDWFQIIRALYGLKTSTRDHSIAAALRLEKLVFVRDRAKRTIFIRMSATIQRMYDAFVDETNKSKRVDLPIPKGKYIVEKSDFDQMEIDNDPRWCSSQLR